MYMTIMSSNLLDLEIGLLKYGQYKGSTNYLTTATYSSHDRISATLNFQRPSTSSYFWKYRLPLKWIIQLVLCWQCLKPRPWPLLQMVRITLVLFSTLWGSFIICHISSDLMKCSCRQWTTKSTSKSRMSSGFLTRLIALRSQNSNRASFAHLSY